MPGDSDDKVEDRAAAVTRRLPLASTATAMEYTTANSVNAHSESAKYHLPVPKGRCRHDDVSHACQNPLE
jgi:hypothetical protein